MADSNLSEQISHSIVKVLSNRIYQPLYSPWSITSRDYSTASGFYIKWRDRPYIVTNAHCVEFSSTIHVKKYGSNNNIRAHLIWIVAECDLALLEVRDADFWREMKPLEFGKSPNKLDKIYACGYPLGGDNISITKGVFNRIQLAPYTGGAQGITLQIDAAINPGNSGGPVVNKEGALIGVAFSGIVAADGIGFVIPNLLIKFFLESMTNVNDVFPGLCVLDIEYQNLSNLSLRRYAKVPDKVHGIYIAASHRKELHSGDILLAIDGLHLEDSGHILLNNILVKYGETSFSSDEFVSFNNYIGLKKPGEVIILDVWRGGKSIQFNIKANRRTFNIPMINLYSPRSYFILMGIVFLPLSLQLIHEMNERGEYICHLNVLMNDINAGVIKPRNQDEIVVLTDIFRTKYTEGFPANCVVKDVNDIHIRNLVHMFEIVAAELKRGEFIKITFEDTAGQIILLKKDIKKFDASIRKSAFGQIGGFNISSPLDLVERKRSKK